MATGMCRASRAASLLVAYLIVVLTTVKPSTSFRIAGGRHGTRSRRLGRQSSAIIRSCSLPGARMIVRERALHVPSDAAKRLARPAAGGSTMSVSADPSIVTNIRSFFDASSISSALNVANSVPPVYYFAYLIAAGVDRRDDAMLQCSHARVGVPVSEDVLVIFVGTLLGSGDFSTRHKMACVAWCYAGVVMSDLLTFIIGRGFRRGLFNPLRRILFKGVEDPNAKLDGSTDAQSLPAGKEQILEKIRRSGRYVGIAERFAVGARGPMTLLCGFTGVPFKGFAAGVAIGALFGTMPIQLALGHALRDRPAAVAAIGTVFISFYALGPPIVAAFGGASMLLSRRPLASRRGREQEQKGVEDGTEPNSTRRGN